MTDQLIPGAKVLAMLTNSSAPKWAVKAVEGMLAQAKWSKRYVDDLPDSAFLSIMPGGKLDAYNKTTPRSLRFFPVMDAAGDLDVSQLRSALKQIPDMETSLSANARNKAKRRASALLRRMTMAADEVANEVYDETWVSSADATGLVDSVETADSAEASSRSVRILADDKGAPEPQRIVYGVVLSPHELTAPAGQAEIVDGEVGEVKAGLPNYAPPDVIERLAHDYMQHSRKTDYKHESVSDAVLLESFVEPYPSSEDYQKALRGEPHSITERTFGNDVVRSGEWIAATRLSESDWQEYLDGKLMAYSITGMLAVTEFDEADMPEITTIRLVPEASDD